MAEKKIKRRSAAGSKEKRLQLFAYAVLVIGAISMIMPFLWMTTTSLKTLNAIFVQPKNWIQMFVPTMFRWENYAEAFRVVPFAKFYMNSIIVGLAVTFGQVLTSSLAAYAFSRLTFPGRDKLFFAYLATMMIPGSVTIIPVYVLMRIFGWVDTYKALIIPTIFSAYGTFMLRQFFMTLPKDLEDAAKIDGCSFFRIFWTIILPLSKPALATLTVFTFMGNWGSFMWPLLVTNTDAMKTLPIGLESFKTQYSTDWHLLMAGSVMAMLPIVIIFIFTQRYFVESIKLTGVKG
ncbi:MAG: carbohydrate ABC transporter permease [Candidatus Omnitrophica bacterium]|nr:carbohydrate ABC transporter permease [Candidatus Omnitrophota bacterium]MDD5311028.1 carbohydrate ABC transporter permease [Candidatus Omnitrophota bacterium]MDD5546548.1 carbohydrate ABC transporter permease [Candidatus Omnitrophota bacterium]